MVNGLTAQFSNMQQIQVRQKIDTAVAKKALDHARSQGDAIVNMIADTAQSAQRIAAEPHKGTMIDVRA